jgi:hypothetical protein
MRKYIIYTILIIFIIISFSIALVNAAEKVTLPTGQTIDLWLKNQKGEDTTTFYPNDEVWIVFYSPSAFNVFADFILNYPESRYPSLTLATNIQVSGSGRVIAYRYLINPTDPEGLYIIRAIVKDNTGRILGQVDLKYNLIVTTTVPPPPPPIIPPEWIMAEAMAIGAIGIFLFTRLKKVSSLKQKNTRLATVLALIPGLFGIWGIGHIYIGKLLKGIALLIVGRIIYWIGIFVIFSTPPDIYIGRLNIIIISIIIWIWQTYDAYKLAKYFNSYVSQYKTTPW